MYILNRLMGLLHYKNFNLHLQEVVRGALSSLSIRVSGTILGFAISVMVARILGAQGAGVYYLSLSALTIASALGRLGFDNTMVRFIASHASVGEWHTVRRVYRKIIRVTTLGSVAISACLIIGAHWLAYDLFDKPYMEVPLVLASLAVVPFSIGSIQADALRGLKQIGASQLIRTFLIPLGLVVLIVPFMHWWQANGAVAAYAVATAVTAVVAWFLWRRSLQGLITTPSGDLPDQHLNRRLFQSSWPLFGVVITGLVMQQAATVVLGITDSAANVGVFNVASRITSLLVFPLLGMISILTPKFAALHRQGMRAELAQLARHSSLLLTAFSLPVTVGMYLGAGWVLQLFGPGFEGGIWVLRILLIGVFVDVATGAVAELLMMTGHEKECRAAHVFGAVITLGICAILIPFTGSIGAAAGMASGIVGKNILLVIMVKKRLGFWPISIDLKKSPDVPSATDKSETSSRPARG